MRFPVGRERSHIHRLRCLKKSCSPDNSACEGFFGRMKNEMFYGEKWDKISVEEFISIINQYMQWYRDKRIKLSLGGLSPMEYRRSLGIA